MVMEMAIMNFFYSRNLIKNKLTCYVRHVYVGAVVQSGEVNNGFCVPQQHLFLQRKKIGSETAIRKLGVLESWIPPGPFGREPRLMPLRGRG